MKARVLIFAAALAAALPALAEEGPTFDASLKILGSMGWQKPTISEGNPDNYLLNLPARTAMTQGRLDLALRAETVNAYAKPRLEWRRDWWTQGEDKGETDSGFDTFLTEGGVTLAALDSLHLSLGRENLQWGPGQFVSPSNPFFYQNGRGNPMKELRGGDFFRAVWMPAKAWSLSYIANVSRGEQEMGVIEWRPSHALKIDWTGEEASAAAIFHGGEEVPASLRGYAQWTASDALLLYGEGSVAEGNRLPYPVADIGPVRGHIEYKYDEGGNRLYAALAGAAYTFEAGPTLSLEYYHNGEGYTDEDADTFATMMERYSLYIIQGYIGRSESLSFGDMPLRRNYLFLQFLQSEIFSKATLLMRLTTSLDDRSSVFNAYADYAASDHFTLFMYGGVWMGGSGEEYGMGVRRMGTVGVEYAAF